MFTLPSQVVSFMDEFRKKDYQIYLVGGPVRNFLLDKHTDNWDFTTNAAPEKISEMFEDSFYNNSFGTVGIPMEIDEKKVIFEVTPFRKESEYDDFRHPTKVEWTDKLEEDLARRDFTINAMAYDGKQIVDPYKGQLHIEERIITAVGDPNIRFQEDALRLMRAVRFTAQLGFTIEEKTLQAVKDNAQLLANISWERIREEFFKILTAEHATNGIMMLKDTGLLKYILPELEACFPIDQKSPNRHHTDDVGTHLVKSLTYCPSTDPITLFATLIHDVGKPPTYKKDAATGQVTFYNHEVVGEKMAKVIAERFKLSNEQKKKLVTLVANHQFTVSELQTDKALRRFIRSVGKEYLQDMLDLRTGDRIGSGAAPTSWRFDLFKKRLEEVQHEPFAVKDLKVDGHDVMKIFNIQPSRKIGDVLDALFEDVVENGVPNDRDVLLGKLEEMKTAQK